MPQVTPLYKRVITVLPSLYVTKMELIYVKRLEKCLHILNTTKMLLLSYIVFYFTKESILLMDILIIDPWAWFWKDKLSLGWDDLYIKGQLFPNTSFYICCCIRIGCTYLKIQFPTPTQTPNLDRSNILYFQQVSQMIY